MNVINVGESSYEKLIRCYTSHRLIDYPVKNPREWLESYTNAVEWCESPLGFDIFVSWFECYYLASVNRFITRKL